MKRQMLAVAVAVATVFSAAAGESPRGVLCLTFDDRDFTGWTTALPLFAQYDAHVTFFPCGELGTNEVAAIGKLQAAGHSVGLHTVSHLNALPFVAECDVMTYVRKELMPQLTACRAAGVEPKYLAYPNNRHDATTDADLAWWYFERFRAGAPVSKFGYYAVTNRPSIVNLDCAFFPVADLPRHRVMEGVGVGEYYHTDIEDVCRALHRAAERDEVFVIYSHGIRPDAKGVSMKTPWLERILATAKELNLPVRSFAELGPVAPIVSDGPMDLMLTFDDAVKDHLLIAAPELEKRGWRGIFCVPTDWVGKDARKLAWEDVRELVRRGHVIATHTKSHPALGALCEKGRHEQVRAEIRESCDVLERETGVRPKLLCLPGGSCHPDVVRIAREEGLETMTVPRATFGGEDVDAAKAVAYRRARGGTKADFLVHGIRPEGGGWRPFPSKDSFIRYLDQIKDCESRGDVRIVLR